MYNENTNLSSRTVVQRTGYTGHLPHLPDQTHFTHKDVGNLTENLCVNPFSRELPNEVDKDRGQLSAQQETLSSANIF